MGMLEDCRFSQVGRWCAIRILVFSSVLAIVPVGYGQAKSVGQTVDRVRILIHRLQGPNSDDRLEAAGELGNMGDARGVLPLIAAMTDKEPEVRRGVAYALGQIGDPRAVQALTLSLKDENPDVRHNAADALAKIRGATSAEPLPESLREPDPKIQKALDEASASGTISAYRTFLALYSSDRAPSSKLYWLARERIEKLIISEMARNGIGQRFRLKAFQPKEDSGVGSLTIEAVQFSPSVQEGYATKIEFEKGKSDFVEVKSLYPGDKIAFGFSVDSGLSFNPPMGNRSVIRFIGKVSLGDDTVDGESKEPLSFLLLKPFGAVYLDGRGTVVTSSGETLSLPISPTVESNRRTR